MSAGRRFIFHAKRDHIDTQFVEHYRCFDQRQEVRFSARATTFGKPATVFRPGDDAGPVAVIQNRKVYLVNGRTDFLGQPGDRLIGSYSRLGRIYDHADKRIGRWRDARSWGEEFKINLVEAIANSLLGAGDAPGGANPGDTHLLSDGKTILATLQREKMPFFPDPPKRDRPGKLARMASKIVPGELGRSLGEITPPRGWTLTPATTPGNTVETELLLYAALTRIEYLRWSRSG